MALVAKSRVSCQWFSQLARALDPRSAPRLAALFLGAVVARGLRTVTSWIRAARLSEDFRRCYWTVAAAGKRCDSVATHLVCDVVNPMLDGDKRVTLALDDTPTERVGPCVEGRGIHHNPTPGPAGSAFVSGHVWVVLAALVPHSLWGTIALPLLARLYVRKIDLAGIVKAHRPKFQTKLELAVALVRWALAWLNRAGKPLWIVVDGAYAMRPFLKPVLALGVTVVSRLRRDAALFTLPEPRGKKQRGRPRIKGRQRIDLAKRAGAKKGWQTATFSLYGQPTAKTFKTFLAYWGPVGGLIRIVLVKEDNGAWRAYFCTDTTASVTDILETVADRFAIEIAFRDLKEIVGAGQQQTRFHFANVGGFHLCLWTFTMTEAWAWNRSETEMTSHRKASSPWDDQPRRPSHADKRNAFRRELLREEIQAVLHTNPSPIKIQQLAERLVNLAA